MTRKAPVTREMKDEKDLLQAWEHAALIETHGDVRVVVSLYPQARRGVWQLRTQAYVPEAFTQPRRAGLVAFEMPRAEQSCLIMAICQQLYSLDNIVKGWRENEHRKE